MTYTAVTFRFSFTHPWQQDLFIQGLADMGFDSFDDDKAYIPAHLLNEPALRAYSSAHGQTIAAISQCDDANWNEQWETEHGIVALPHGIIIHPDGAFGAGDHATTAMMLDAMADMPDTIQGKNVLDMGCGTGVLGIMAAKLGAAKVTMVDIDERAVKSAAANAELNNVVIETIHGSTPPDAIFDVILANIHRNIIISLMPRFRSSLSPHGRLLLSGFYENDINAILNAAAEEGLTHYLTHSSGEWRMIQLYK